MPVCLAPPLGDLDLQEGHPLDVEAAHESRLRYPKVHGLLAKRR